MKEMEYKKGRVFVGNPPFGNASSLFKRFRNGAMEKGDWAVYIGPASHWNMKWGLKGMELVYSEHLGGVEYRGLENKKVNTCINVYRRISGNIVDRRMEMLERDFEITVILNDNYGYKGPKKEYDFLIRSSTGFKYVGTLVKDTKEEPKALRYIGINVKNKSLYNQTKEFLNNIKIEDRRGVKMGYYQFNGETLKSKMIEEFYPTREEMLERDFEVRIVEKRPRLNNDYDWKEADFHISYRGNGNTGEYHETPYLGCYAGIKIKNKELYERCRIFVENFKDKNFQEMKDLSSTTWGIRIPYLKQKMIEEFYSDIPEYFENTYIEEKKENYKE